MVAWTDAAYNRCMAKKKNTAPAFAKRWGADVANLGWTMVPNVLVEKLHTFNVSPSTLLTLIVLLRFWYQDGDPRVFKKKIGDSIGISTKQVGKNLATLERLKIIKRSFRKKPGNPAENDSTEFDLQPLVQMVKDHARVLAEARTKANAARDAASRKKKAV